MTECKHLSSISVQGYDYEVTVGYKVLGEYVWEYIDSKTGWHFDFCPKCGEKL